MAVCNGRCCKQWLKDNIQLIAILICIVIGIIVGFLVQRTNPDQDVIMWISFPGEIFLRIFNVCIIPLIFFCLISGVSAIDPKANGKLGGLAIAYVLFQDFLGTIFGVVLALAIKPGTYMPDDIEAPPREVMLKTQDIFADLFRNIFTDNIVRAMMQKVRTDYVETSLNGKEINQTTANITKEYTRTLVAVNSTNLQGILVFCIVFGMAIGSLGKKSAILREFALAGTAVTMKVLSWAMWMCPLGVASLTAGAIMRQSNLAVMFARIGMLVVTAVSGNILQIIFVYPLVYLVLTRRNPWTLLSKCGRIIPMAFALCSSIVIMPEYFLVCKSMRLSPRVSAMVVPLITTILGCGSALYIAAASIFLAQYTQIELNAAQIILIIILTTISVLALPASPSSSVIVVIMMMSTLRIPSHAAGVLFAIDWFLDRVRTASNGVAKIFGMAIINIICEEVATDPELGDEEKKDDKNQEEMKAFLTHV